MRRALLAAVMVAVAAPAFAIHAQAVSTVPLTRGESVNFLVDDHGAVMVSRGRAGPLSDYDRASINLVLQTDPKLFMGPNTIGVTSDQPGFPEAPPVAPDAINIRFVAVGEGGGHSFLVLENGYDRAFVYRARMTVRGHSQPTDVCVVLPRRSGSEHWPYVIDRIELSGFRLEPWDETQGPRCE